MITAKKAREIYNRLQPDYDINKELIKLDEAITEEANKGNAKLNVTLFNEISSQSMGLDKACDKVVDKLRNLGFTVNSIGGNTYCNQFMIYW